MCEAIRLHEERWQQLVDGREFRPGILAEFNKSLNLVTMY